MKKNGRQRRREKLRSSAIKCINSFVRLNSDLSYSQFINRLVVSGFVLDRKSLADLGVYEPKSLLAVVVSIKYEK